MKAVGICLLVMLLTAVVLGALVLATSGVFWSAADGSRSVPAIGDGIAWLMLLGTGAVGSGAGASRLRGDGPRGFVLLGLMAGLLAPVLALGILVPALVWLRVSMNLGADAGDYEMLLLAGLMTVSVTLAVWAALAVRGKRIR